MERFRLSDSSRISLPFRLVEVRAGYERGKISFKGIGAAEYRYSEYKEARLDLREAYAVWYPEFGEIKAGKQIFAWGAVDGNNPTDNLSAYDFYYMFSPGVERKIGTPSASANIYRGAWSIEIALIPFHQKNRLPFNEPDFPLSQPTAIFDPRDHLVEVDDPFEYGARLMRKTGIGDFSASYFSGHDRGFTLYNVVLSGGKAVPESFGYREIKVIGGDFVTFLGGTTVRGEAAFFMTETPGGIDMEHSAKYAQYALQAEYGPDEETTLSCQFLGQEILDFVSDSVSEDDFNPGMGMPLIGISDRMAQASASRFFLDRRLEVKGTGFIDLKGDGGMAGLGLTYSPKEGWEAEIGLNKFISNGGKANIFNALEDFSHYSAGVKYYF